MNTEKVASCPWSVGIIICQFIMNTSILPSSEEEAFDAPKKFLNIDTEKFEFTWDGKLYVVHPGEVAMYPKYLVNYAAMHLAKKIYKRQMFANFKGTEMEKGNANIKFVDAKEQKNLQDKMVALNFPDRVEVGRTTETTTTNVPQETSVPTQPVTTTVAPQPANTSLRCEKCNRDFKSPLGLHNHSLRMHKTA